MPNFLACLAKKTCNPRFALLLHSLFNSSTFIFLNSTKAMHSFSWSLFKLCIHLLALAEIFTQVMCSLIFSLQFSFCVLCFLLILLLLFLTIFVKLSWFIFLSKRFHVFVHWFNLQLFALLCFICTLFASIVVFVIF